MRNISNVKRITKKMLTKAERIQVNFVSLNDLKKIGKSSAVSVTRSEN